MGETDVAGPIGVVDERVAVALDLRDGEVPVLFVQADGVRFMPDQRGAELLRLQFGVGVPDQVPGSAG